MKTALHRREVVEFLLKDRRNLLVVAGLGSTAWDITAVGDAPLNFPMWGAMGNAAMFGLGLALAQPKRRVLVLTGDGEMLMGMGSLATIGVQKPRISACLDSPKPSLYNARLSPAPPFRRVPAPR